MPIIEVDHVTKEYRLGQLQSLKHSLQHGLATLRGHRIEKPQPFKALDDISFRIEEGEVIGIIGHNGAGKSTVLKLLSRITRPTRGSVRVKGKVAPLIEVGAGLVGEMTGRENIYLNGAILGISKHEIRRKFDEIVEFAELEAFIETPVKRYSTGMQMRLGFAIATSVEHDVLVVDEVLAVGDLAFQRKCFDRMEHLIKKLRKTVVLVSHNIRQVDRVCNRALLLDQGRVISDGQVSDVCNLFFARSDRKIQADAARQGVLSASSRIDSTGDVALVSLRIVNPETRESIDAVVHGEDLTIELQFATNSRLENPVFAVGVHTTDLLYLTTARSAHENFPSSLAPGTYSVVCTVKRLSLLPGPYALRTSISGGHILTTLLYAENLCHFSVRSTTLSRSEVASGGFFTISTSWHLQPAVQTERQAAVTS